jgi:hypothetical protein
MSICGDTNYKIRTDGAIFLKHYFAKNHEKLIDTPRFKDSYIPELCELCNDEEVFIRIEAIEAIHYVLDKLNVELVEREVIPEFIKMFDCSHEEIIVRLSQIIGSFTFKL